jgi:hypothetical protein
MARMIPDYMPTSHNSAGEEWIFGILKKSNVTSTWIVLHSLDLPDHVSNICGEIDFVIMVPDYGILCLEVKGHERIARNSGSWYFGSDPTPDPRGPFKQASSAAHSFRKELAKRLPHLCRVPVWSAVSLPFGQLDYNASEWHPWQLFQKQDSSPDNLPRSILLALKSGFNKLKEALHLGANETVKFDGNDAESVVKAFRGDFEILISPKDRKILRLSELKKFTTEQYFVIDGIREAPRAYVAGPAGTGKTCLAIEAARREPSSSSVLFVCFNSLLAQSLQKQLAGCTNIYVTTIHKLMIDQVGPTAWRNENDRDFFEDVLPRLFEDAFLTSGQAWKQYDALIVDEAQDVVCKHLITALDVSIKGGLSGGRWRMFGDPEAQAIYNVSNQILRRNVPGNPAPFDIRINCRNTPRVSQYAEILGGLRPGYTMIRRPDDKIDPYLAYYADDSDQVAKVCEILGKAYDAGFLGEEIVLLSSREESSVARKLPSRWRDRLTPARKAKTGCIRYCTIHAFKGLDASVVILADIDPVALRVCKPLFYIGITRALHQLNILIEDTAKGLVGKLFVEQLSI